MRVAVALSGGVDSSVAAALLVEAGHEVVGITLQQWPRGADSAMGRHGGCCSLDAVEDARRVASRLGIPYYCWNLEREFGERVIQPFHDAYRAGRTPNPCLSCNAFVRFDLMLARVMGHGFDAMATGHYARIVPGPDGPELHSAADPAKDQSYVLYHLDRQRLGRLILPLGEMEKASVRAHARRLSLPVADKPESMEICFVGGGRTADHIARSLPLQPGTIVDGAGRELGTHRGTPLYTVGQRSGFGALAEAGPWFVTAIDAGRNRLVVGRREDLARSAVRLEDVSFIAGSDSEVGPVRCEARLRYRAAPIAATYEEGVLRLDEPFLGPAPGQAAVLYRGTRVLGGGIIASAA